jgi:sulfoxide reductase heme-binding subunit YedZ
MLPLCFLLWNGLNEKLGANPIAEITNTTGIWTLRLILLTLTVTPLRRMTGWHHISTYRRMLGLFAFTYGAMHFVTYIWLDQFFDFGSILADIPKRPFITIGFASFILMIPLAVTSTKGMIRRMGGKYWNLLHRLFYCTAIGGVIHYLWRVKVIESNQILYAVLIAILLLIRVWFAAEKKFRPQSTLR